MVRLLARWTVGGADADADAPAVVVDSRAVRTAVMVGLTIVKDPWGEEGGGGKACLLA